MCVDPEIRMDPVTQMPIVVLRDLSGDTILPCWVGLFEANSIALELDGIATPRPMTHDLFVNTLNDLGVKVDRVVIADLRDRTFFAEIHLEHQGKTYVADSRPSDAISVALRAGAKIFVREEALAKGSQDGGIKPVDMPPIDEEPQQ